MKSSLAHIQINIKAENKNFYKELFLFLGWSVLLEGEGSIGFSCEKGWEGTHLWFSSELKNVTNDYDGSGMNHLAISVNSQKEVDLVTAFLSEHNIQPLFDTPRHRPEFSAPEKTYYQVMFESADKILFEVVYIGTKQ